MARASRAARRRCSPSVPHRLLAIVSGASSQPEADILLNQIELETDLTWNEPTFQFKEPNIEMMIEGSIDRCRYDLYVRVDRRTFLWRPAARRQSESCPEGFLTQRTISRFFSSGSVAKP